MICSAQYTIRDASDVHVGPMEPSPVIGEQLWLDTSVSPNLLKRWTGSGWMPASNRTIVDNNPATTGYFAGDMCIKPAEGNKLYRFDGLAWVLYQDQSIPVLSSAVENMMLALSGGSTIFHQYDAPQAGIGKGDLWYDTNDNNKCYRYDGGAWVQTSFTNVIETIEKVAETVHTDDEIVSTVRSSAVYTADMNAKANSSDIADMATKAYVSTINASEIAQRNDAISIAISTEKQRAEAVEGAIRTFTDLAKTYFDFIEAGLSISKEGSDFSVLISNNRLSFLQGTTEVAYLSDSKLYITHAQVKNTLTIGSAGDGKGYTDIAAETNGLCATWRAT